MGLSKKQFDAMAADLRMAREENAKLKTVIEEKTNTAKWSAERAQKAENELDQVHAFFDALPNALPRKGDNYEQRTVMTRFATWIAQR